MSFMQSVPRPTPTYHTTTYPRISTHHAFDGSGKTVLVTGGAGGVGLSICRAFAAAGVARVIIVSRSASQQEATKHELETLYPATQFSIFPASITDKIRMAEMLHEIGTIDVLVLNAAIAHRRAAASELRDEEVQDAFEVNTFAAFDIARTFLASKDRHPDSSRSRQKSIIYVSSAAAHMTNPYRAAYGASKAAGTLLMQSLAAQYACPAYKIVCLHPGSIYTPGVALNMPRDMPGAAWDEPELAADFTLWLAGQESEFLHGRFVWANWDVDELVKLKETAEKHREWLTIGLIQ